MTQTTSTDALAPSPVPAARADCLHCGLLLTGTQRERGDTFCCPGCERVYTLLHEAGLEQFYELRRGPGLPPPETGGESFAWLDELLVGDPSADPVRPITLTLDIQGIHCAGCVWVLESLFRRHPGGVDLRINPSVGKADLIWVPARGELKEWLAQAERFGYRFGPSRKHAPHGSRDLLIRMGISSAAAANVMIFSLCYYFGLAPEDGLLYSVLGRLSFLLALVAVLAGGWVFLRAAFLGLRHGLVHLDLPIAVGILLAFGGSSLAFLRHGPEAAYFDTVTIFITLMLVGRWLQERVLERNRNALLVDGGMDHLATRRFEKGRLSPIPAAEIRPGDVLWIVPGDLVPVEGILVEEPARISLAWITGESDQRTIDPGEAVPAGAVNTEDRTLRVAAQEPFGRSRLHELLGTAITERDAVPGAAGQSWWRRVSAVYVTAVFVLAALGFLLWGGRDMDKAVQVTVAVLVVACPCALGLATPLAHELMQLALRRRGVLLREGGFLDRALSVRKVLFDKTGTLTLGKLTLSPGCANAVGALDHRDRSALGTLTMQSNHPVSRAVAEALSATQWTLWPEASVREVRGQGLTLEYQGDIYRLGRPEFAAPSPGASGDGGAIQILFSRDDTRLLSLRLDEEIKEDACEEIEELRAAGLDIYILSGDVPEKVSRVAEMLGVDPDHTRAGMTPEEKAEWVRRLDRGDTLVVGDGLNDGPALDQATCAATPAVEHPSLPGRSDFYFLGAGIAAVRRALLGARELRRVIRANLAVAVAYNIGALVLCYLGMVSPVVAAILMPVSSVAVVSLTTWRLTGRRLKWMS